jgi:hypothetical protein
LDRARSAPCLATAQIPDAAVIAADPAMYGPGLDWDEDSASVLHRVA